jgi:hypothetical protein
MGGGMDMWNAAVRMAEAMHARAAEVARIRRERRNERRREAYSLKVRLGIPTRKPKPVPESEPEYVPPTECYCSAAPRPPCAWCESGARGGG